jgi:hypothetical protein
MDRIQLEALKRKLELSGSAEIRIVSDSMFPLLSVGEILEIKPLPAKLNPYDLLVFYDQNRLTCHFLWLDQRALNDSVVTRSLRAPQEDDIPVPSNHLLGWVPQKKISRITRFKIFFGHLCRRLIEK